MSPGSSTESYPAFARIGLRENPGKNLNQVTCPDRDSNPGHLVSQPDALTVTPQKGNSWISTKKGLSSSQWTQAIKMNCNAIPVRTLPGRTLDSTRCRRCDEQETLPHVLGFCHHGELLRINRHNTVRSLIAASIRQNASYEVYEEVGCVSSDGSTRRADIIIIDRQKDKGVILDPTIRFEMHEQQPQENIARNGNIKIGDLSFEGVENFKYLGATATNVNDTREEIKRRINMGNACYYSVEKLLSSCLLSKNLKVRIYKTVTLPVVLYGCETWTLTLREEHRLRVFENKVLRKIFGAKRDEVTGEWRKLHNAELHALYSSPDIIRNIKSRRLRWAGHVARMGESRNAYRVLVGRPERKRPLGRPRRRWEDNVKMDLREVGYDDRDWINLAQDRDRWRAYVRAAMNLRVP
ncbi:hypothetical protein ANN_27173 [Periplaneta americana]|uniref:Reverse transcriptase n=1 Tax=Periplaneta americana TaxID=6978 RepID=A0ABQ8RXC5_PERAM|nr:hypothetical protein ANN_27173 [Periplaneta americana]